MTTEATVGTDPRLTFRFDNSYARLPDRFFARLAPTPVAAPRLVKLNQPLARELAEGQPAVAQQRELVEGRVPLILERHVDAVLHEDERPEREHARHERTGEGHRGGRRSVQRPSERVHASREHAGAGVYS